MLLTYISINAQDCECKLWKRTYYYNGEPRFEYSMGCDQPTSAFEFVRYDFDECKKLKKQRQEELQKDQLEEKNKLKFYDGYKIVGWHDFIIDKPKRLGIKQNSFKYWDKEGTEICEGHIDNNKVIQGIVYSPLGVTLDFSVAIKLIQSDITNKEYVIGDVIYAKKWFVCDLFNGEIFENDYSYVQRDKCKWILFIDGVSVMVFNKFIDDTSAIQKYKNIETYKEEKRKKILAEDKKMLDEIESKRKLKEKNEKDYIDSLDRIKSIPLSVIETDIVGNWEFKSSNLPIKKGESSTYIIRETFKLNSDRTYDYFFELLMESYSYGSGYSYYGLEYFKEFGIWELKNSILTMHIKSIISNRKRYQGLDLMPLERIKLLKFDKISKNRAKRIINVNEFEFIKTKYLINIDKYTGELTPIPTKGEKQ